MKENWQRVKEIFAEVLESPPHKRDEYIGLYCSDNEELRSEVESLFSSYDSAESFLESPAVGEVADRVVDGGRELKAGDTLNHYEILSKIGTGGMGNVYLANDSKLDRHVAIKVLNQSFDEGQSNLKRFFQEAKAASALNHPNIIVVYEIGEVDGLHYIVIEFVRGSTLSDSIKRKDLSLEQITDCSIQIVNALAAAHAVGIIHRDIKPDNIMMRGDGIVKVLDFGLAKLTDKNTPKADFEAQTRELLNTKAGVIMGTAAFMSPEQTRGKGVDARTDIWSFGVVLFQMLTGRQPFSGETTSDIIAAILTKETPRLEEFVSDIPAELERIVRKTLRKSRKARYQTASELLDDLKHFRHDLEFGEKTEHSRSSRDDVIRSGRDTEPQYSARTDGRVGPYSGSFISIISEAVSEIKVRPKSVLLGLTGVALIIVAFIVGAGRMMAPDVPLDAFQNMRLSKLTFEGTTTNVTSISPDGKYIVYALREGGKEALMVRQVATGSVVQIMPPDEVDYDGLAFTPDGNYIYYNVSMAGAPVEIFEIPVLGGNPRKIVTDAGENVTISPDGKMIAFVRSRTSLMLADAKGGSQRLLAISAPAETRSLLAWNPNGKTILSSIYSKSDSHFHLVEVSLEDGTEKRLASPPWLRINGLKWLADGSGIIISGRDTDTQFSQIWHISYPSGEPRRITNDFSTYLDVSLTSDNNSLVAIKEERLFNIWVMADAKTEIARKITLEEGRDDGMSGVAWAPNDKIVYTVRKTGTIDLWIVNTDGSENRQLTFDQGLNVFPIVSPDGRFIVFTSNRTGNQKIWRMDIDGSNPVALTDALDAENYPSFTPDGRWIVYQRTNADNLTTIWKLNLEGGDPIKLTEIESVRPTVSPDGKVFACEYGKGEPGNPVMISIIPIDGGKPLKILDLPLVYQSRTFRWTADGKALVYVDSRNRNHNLWSQLLDGGPPQQLTFFESGQIGTGKFDLARDGKGVALSRGNESSDVVMMSDFR